MFFIVLKKVRLSIAMCTQRMRNGHAYHPVQRERTATHTD
jgi:hypothetical protein